MGSPYFKNTYFPDNNEAKLYANATHEVIEIRGVDMYFLPRDYVKNDDIFGEDTLGSFTKNSPITFYIENYSNFDGLGDIFGKFGFTPDNQITLSVEIDNFNGIVGQPPKEDDLIYYPVSDRIFEVIHVEDKDGFYQLNHKEYSYKIVCKLYEYSHEDINTNIDEIDIINQEPLNTSDEEDQLSNIDDILDLSESDIFGNL